ncbi:MAG TPA: TIGR03118 family protein [Terriglobales bacterium]|nr:TIGR03118 family protein [Terriglobales bacterium]
MHLVSRRSLFFATLLGLALVLLSSASLAQYKKTNLVSNLPTGAKHQDTQLQNAWGLAYAPSNPFWISDNYSGLSTLYDGTGVKQSLVVTIPTASGTGVGSPTGIVYNGSQEFKLDTWVSAFIFCTLDGTISGWSHFSPSKALLGVNNSASGASYTGLGITSKTSGNRLYAADFNNNKVDVFDGMFQPVTSFTDHSLPAGFAPANIQDINGQLYVAFADTAGGAGGFIDIFNENGTFVKTLVSGAPLNQPWGMAIAPSNFGALSNTLLVANNTNTGTINGFDLSTGALVGTIKNAAGKPIKINQLWGIEFGGGTVANGKTNQLFYTAGPKNGINGLFGVIQ